MEINGKKVVDAKTPLKIRISKADTVRGANKDPGACAAARAAKRVPNCISARVHIGRVYVEQKKHWLRYMTGDALRSEIIAFDRGGSFAPGTYEIKVPAPTERLTYRKSARRIAKDRALINPKRLAKLKMPRKLHVVQDVRQHGANR